jgi:hypothetical protein
MNSTTENPETQRTTGPAGNTTVSRKMLWAGRIMSALPVLMLLFSAVMKLAKPPAVVERMAKAGIPEHLTFGIGILELACTILYVIPQTAVLGAILLTGYLGGAIMTHLRLGEAWIGPAVFGVFIWGGPFLRDPRLRALIPLRKPQ